MDLPPLPLTPASIPGAVPAAVPVAGQVPGDPAVPDAGATPATDFAELLAAGLALPAAVPEATLAADLGASEEKDPADLAAADLAAPGQADTTLTIVLAAIAHPGTAPAPAPAASGDAPPPAQSGATGLELPGLPAAARDGREPAPAAQLAPLAAEIEPAPAAAHPQADAGVDLAATLAAAAAAAPRAQQHAVHAPVATAELRSPVGMSGWDAQLGRTVVWMAGGGLQTAEVRLNPPDLGPLEIVLRLSGDDGSQASVTFASPHAEVRAALETALPRLRDMLAESGITLGQANVNAETFRDAGGARHEGSRAGGDTGSGGAAGAQAPAVMRTWAGLVDIFA